MEKLVPDSWFIGFGNKNHGILSIVLDQDVIPGWDEELDNLWNDFSHFNRSFDGAKELTMEMIAIFTQANKAMQEKLGFTADQVLQHQCELLEELQGKKEARIKFELY